MTTRGTKRQEKEAESSSQPQELEGTASTSKAVIELLLEQQKTQQEQQRMLMSLLEQQRDELAQHRREMSELRARQEEKATARLLKPTLQKLGPDNDVEHFLATFERIARQQGWPEEVWATQLAGLLTGKALAAYAGLNGESAASCTEVKKAIFHRCDVSEETHRRRFRTDRKSPEAPNLPVNWLLYIYAKRKACSTQLLLFRIGEVVFQHTSDTMAMDCCYKGEVSCLQNCNLRFKLLSIMLHAVGFNEVSIY